MKTVRLFIIVGLGVLLVSSLVLAKELHVGIATEPWDLDPAIRTDTGSGHVIKNVYDSLIELDQNNEPTTEFALCKRWEWKNNAQTITLYLREGVKFHDGTDFTAADVKYNIEWQLDPENAAPNIGLLGPIESVNIIDDYTLEVNFTAPYTPALQQWSRALDGIVPQWAHGERSEEKGTAGFAGTDLSRDPVGTGPFKFVDWVSGSHITLEKFDDYWVEGVPAVDRVVFEFIGEPAVMEAALIAGSIDIVDKVPFRDFDYLSGIPGIVTKRIPGIQTQVIYVNLGAPPFGISADQIGDQAAIDKAYNLRKFLFHAIDREELAEGIFYGMASIQYGPWYADSDWTSPNLKGMTLHDPVLAREYLTKGGYPDGGLSFRMMCTSAQWFCDVSTVIQEQLRPYGVQVEVIPLDKSAFLDTMYETFDWDTGMEDWGLNNFLAISWLYSGYYRNNHNHNHWHHTAPDLAEHYHETVPGHAEFCALYDQAIVEPDEQKRKELVWKLQEMVTEDVIQIDLMFLDNLHAWRDTVKGYGNGLNSRGEINLKYIAWSPTAPVCLNAGVQIEIDDPTTASTDFRTVDFGIFRTLAPKVRITLQHPFPQDFQVIVDDGDDCTADDLTITSLYSVTGNVAEADIPEIIPVNSLPGPNQDVFRILPDDPTSVRIFYFGENRIRVLDPVIGSCDSFLLNYEAFDETVVGIDDGVELFPGEIEVEIMTNHIIMDFDEEIVSDADISSVLLTEKLRPQGITRDLGVIQARPLDVLDAPSLLARMESINIAGYSGLQEARVDLVVPKPAVGGELYPEAFKKDFQKATSDWRASVRQNQYHHFIIQTLPAHRLIDITKSGTIQVLLAVEGIGNRDNLSSTPNVGSKFFVKGARIKKPIKIVGRGTPDAAGRTFTTDPAKGAADKADGDVRSLTDDGAGHDTKVLSILGGDGVGNKTGLNLKGNNVVLGTGKDADIRIVGFTPVDLSRAFENAYYAALEISESDRTSKIHVIEQSYNTDTSSRMSNLLKTNLIKKYKAVANSGKIIIGAAWNENSDVANTDVGRISPDRTSSRSSNTGNNAFKQRVLAVGASDRVLSPNVLEVKRGSSNKGEEIGVVAPGQEIRGTDRTGNLTNSSGTSFSTPIVVGIAAELMLVDTTLQQAANLPKVLEFIEATADDIGTAGRDNDTGFGRVNFWKAVLSAANGGLSKEGRTEAADDKGKDSFFKFLPLKDAAATKWYGFEVRVSTKNAVLWFRKNDGTFLKVEDAGAKRPALDSIAESVVTAFMSTQSHRNANKILPSLPFSSTELTNAGVKQWYLARFSMKKDQLANKTHLLAVKPGKTPITTAEGGDVVLSLPLNLKEMRKASASSNQAIKKRVKEFDDFVFYISL